MIAFSRARELLRALIFRRREERDLDDELRFHLEMEAAANEQRGMTPLEARRRACASFGGVERYKEEVRDARGAHHLERLAIDMRYAVRWLRRSPAFTITAVAALALGIGANTAVFSVVNGVILRPLPFPHPERVRFLGWDYGNGSRIPSLTPLEFEFWRERSTVFEGVATSRTFTAELNGDAAEPLVHGVRVSGDFFDVVGTRPAIGRSFAREENEPGGPRTVILSHRFWLGRLGGDSSVLGRPLRLGKDLYTIVGIMPASFRLVGNAASSNEVIVPLQLRVDPRDEGHNYSVVARLRPDRSKEEVKADLARVAAEFHAAHPELSNQKQGSVYLASYGQVYTGELATTLWILLGATVFVLFIASPTWRISSWHVHRDGNARSLREWHSVRDALASSGSFSPKAWHSDFSVVVPDCCSVLEACAHCSRSCPDRFRARMRSASTRACWPSDSELRQSLTARPGLRRARRHCRGFRPHSRRLRQHGDTLALRA